MPFANVFHRHSLENKFVPERDFLTVQCTFFLHNYPPICTLKPFCFERLVTLILRLDPSHPRHEVELHTPVPDTCMQHVQLTSFWQGCNFALLVKQTQVQRQLFCGDESERRTIGCNQIIIDTLNLIGIWNPHKVMVLLPHLVFNSSFMQHTSGHNNISLLGMHIRLHNLSGYSLILCTTSKHQRRPGMVVHYDMKL